MSAPQRPHRTLHLLDLDNLLGGSNAPRSSTVVESLVDRYEEAVGIEPGDHVVVAACTTIARDVFFDLPVSWRRLIGRGVDGADRALVEALPVDFIAARYNEVIIGSGDHFFAPLARELVSRGLIVAVACHSDRLSHCLNGVVQEGVRFTDEKAAAIAA